METDVMDKMQKQLMTSEVNATPLGKTVMLFFTFEGEEIDKDLLAAFKKLGITL